MCIKLPQVFVACGYFSSWSNNLCPRVHDFRHTYAVHCLKKWIAQEKDLAAYFPVMKTYLGHDSFEDTAHYLRLTADIFPEITVRLETCYPDMIPELGGNADEAD